jgi:hypothetical protein
MVLVTIVYIEKEEIDDPEKNHVMREYHGHID